MNKRETVAFAVWWAIEATAARGGLSSPRHLADDCLALLRLAGHHLRACQTGPPEQIHHAEVDIGRVLAPYGMGAIFQRDPSGATVRLRLPSRPNDPAGYAIPQDGFTERQMERRGR